MKIVISYKGQIKPLTEWCRLLGVNYRSIQSRLSLGWSMDQAVERSVKYKKEKEKRVLTRHKSKAVQPTAIRPGARAPIGYNIRTKVTKAYNYSLLLRAVRRQRWVDLKKELGEEYLSNVHRNCTVAMKVA